jgi:hypothetical protein
MKNKLWALVEWSILLHTLCEGELIDIVNYARRDVENAFSSSTSSSKYSLVTGSYGDVMNNYLHAVQIALCLSARLLPWRARFDFRQRHVNLGISSLGWRLP